MFVVEDDEKACPRCAETIKSAAVVCRFCQHDLVHGGKGYPAKPNSLTAYVTSNQEHLLNIIGGIVGTSLIAFFLVSYGVFTPKISARGNSPETSSNDSPPLKVSSIELGVAYAGNEVAAQNTYGHRTLDVSGMVGKVSLDADNNPVVQFMSGDADLPVQAEFDSSYNGQIKDWVFGQMVTVECESVTSVASEPLLKKCSILPPEKPQPDTQSTSDQATEQPSEQPIAEPIAVSAFEYKQNQNHETIELDALNDDLSCATTSPLSGIVVSRNFDSDGTTVKDFVIAMPDGTRQNVGVSLSENLGEFQRNVAIDGLQRLLKPGRMIQGHTVLCGVSGSNAMLDQIQ